MTSNLIDHRKQNSHLTFQANIANGRHGWLRLTPAYSYRLVARALARTDIKARAVLDPFSGTGTTGLVASEFGLAAHLVDVNPFLLWLARVKTRNYSQGDLEIALRIGNEIVKENSEKTADGLWQPAIHRIDRWWTQNELDALSLMRDALDRGSTPPCIHDILLVAFCRTLIRVSNAAFNHQSMSFQHGPGQLTYLGPGSAEAWEVFVDELHTVVESAKNPIPGSVVVHRGDARNLEPLSATLGSVDLLYTSPPYANRISYIREMRPYMYWLRYLHEAKEAGQLDWLAIGGTWGVATSRLMSWEPPQKDLPIGGFSRTLAEIRRSHTKNGDLLARYVQKYFFDMSQHFQSAFNILRPGGKVIYVVGNSFFYGVNVPTHEWYQTLLREAGFEHVAITPIRKRNSKKGLFEYIVEGLRP